MSARRRLALLAASVVLATLAAYGCAGGQTGQPTSANAGAAGKCQAPSDAGEAGATGDDC